MAIYKVHIKCDVDKTTYITNGTVLASVIFRADLGKYEVTMPNNSTTVDTAEEADKAARNGIESFMATVGVVPNFIND